MAYTTEITNRSVQYDIENSHQTFLIGEGTLVKSASYGLFETDKWHENTIVVNGTIEATSTKNAIYSLGDKTSVKIGETGSITSQYGIAAYGDHFMLVNRGEVTASVGQGVYMGGETASFRNLGTVNGTVSTGSSTNSDITLEKTGTVDGGLFLGAGTGLETKTVNLGTVVANGSGWAYHSSDADDTLINRGKMTGGVAMDDGNDLIDNRGGTLITNRVSGGKGNDTFIIDSHVEIRDYAGEGFDTLKSSVSQDLSSTTFFQVADIEKLVLIGKGSINAKGDEIDNELIGNSGNNRLSGGGGADLLTGNAGGDIFVFSTGFGKDTIGDFGRGADRINLSKLDGVNDFADLVKHHLTMTNGDAVITAGGDMLVLDGVSKSDLSAGDFIF
jgi:Ca2+-binding RTX toxin-like protein